MGSYTQYRIEDMGQNIYWYGAAYIVLVIGFCFLKKHSFSRLFLIRIAVLVSLLLKVASYSPCSMTLGSSSDMSYNIISYIKQTTVQLNKKIK